MPDVQLVISWSVAEDRESQMWPVAVVAVVAVVGMEPTGGRDGWGVLIFKHPRAGL